MGWTNVAIWLVVGGVWLWAVAAFVEYRVETSIAARDHAKEMARLDAQLEAARARAGREA